MHTPKLAAHVCCAAMLSLSVHLKNSRDACAPSHRVEHKSIWHFDEPFEFHTPF